MFASSLELHSDNLMFVAQQASKNSPSLQLKSKISLIIATCIDSPDINHSFLAEESTLLRAARATLLANGEPAQFLCHLHSVPTIVCLRGMVRHTLRDPCKRGAQ